MTTKYRLAVIYTSKDAADMYKVIHEAQGYKVTIKKKGKDYYVYHVTEQTDKEQPLKDFVKWF